MGKHEKGEEPNTDGDWGLNYEREYVIPRFMVWVRSNYTVYPNGECADLQPADLMQDFYRLLNRLDTHIYKLRD